MRILVNRSAAAVGRVPSISGLETISPDALEATVRELAFPRHFVRHPEANARARDLVVARFVALGLETRVVGRSQNVVAQPPGVERARVLVGAHFDSVPFTPGADDNASAVAAMLECVRVVAGRNPAPPVVFVAFNREEERMRGSRELLRVDLRERHPTLCEAHVLEMLGCRRLEPGSQKTPAGLPIRIPDRGDFLGLVANWRAGDCLERLIARSRSFVPELDVLGLELPPGGEYLFPALWRSDHAPFWWRQRPALLWTDTAELRNPHYHRPSDTPDTLDYGFLASVTRLLTAQVLSGMDDPSLAT
jgi:hypothetical protein